MNNQKLFGRGVLLAVVAGLFAAGSAQAASYTWANSNVPGTSGITSQTLDWFTGGPNSLGLWTGPVIPVNNDNTTTIQFFTTVTSVGPTVNPSTATDTSNINNGGSPFVLGTLKLGGKGQGTWGANQVMVISGDALNFSAATGTINLDTTLTASRSVITWNVNSAIQLGTASSASALTLTGNGDAVFNIGGIISELQAGGGSLTKSGTSTVRLTGANTYTGGTTISAGTLQLGNGGTTGSLSISSAIGGSGGVLAINRSNAVSQGTDFSGAAITGAIGFTQAGTGGTTTLNAANSYSGLTLVSAGTLVLNGTNSSAGNTQVGNGNGGTLSLGTGTNNGLAGGTITFNNGFIQSSDANARTVSNAISVGSSSVPSIAVNGTGNIFFTDTSTVGLSSVSGKTVFFVLSNGSAGTTTFAQSFANGSVNGDLVKNGLGTLIFTGNSSYTGVTTIQQGTLSINTIKDYGANSAIGASTTGLSIKFGDLNKTGTLLYTGAEQSTDRTIQIGVNSGTPGSSDTGGATIQNDGTGALTFSAATFNTQTIAATGVGANRTLTLTGSNNGTISGIIQDNQVTSPATGTATIGVTKSGTGTWTLSGNNTYSGATTVSAGTLSLTGTLGSGGGTAITVNGATANFTESSAGVIAGTSSFTLTLGSATLAGANTYTGATTINGGTLSVGSIGTTASANSNIGAGTSTLVFNGGTLLYTGASFVSDRAFTINNGVTATINTANDLTLAGATGAATTGALTKTGTGTLTLTGANTYTGATTVNSGTLLLDMTTGALNPADTVTMGGGTLTLKGTSGSTSQTLGNMTITAATGSRIVLNSNGGSGVALTLGNTWTRAANDGSTLGIDLSSGNVTLTAASVTVVNSIVTGSGNAAFPTVTDASGTGFGTVSGGNVIRYTAATTLASSSSAATTNFKTKVGDAGYTGNTLTMTTAAHSVNTLELDSSGGTGVLDLGGAADVLTVTARGILATGANSFTIQNGQVGAVNIELIVHQFATGTLTISGTVGSGTTVLTKDGPGTLILSGANAYTGATYVNQGILRLANNTAAGTTGAITVQNGAALELSGGINIGNKTITVTGTGVANGGALQNYSGTNTYGGAITVGTGGTRINSDAGLLILTNGIVTAIGKDLTVGGSGSMVISNIVSGAGGLIKDGTGTLTLTTNNTYTGATTVNNGTLAVVTGSSCSNSAVTVAANKTLQVRVTDTNKPWACSSLALNDASKVQFTFEVTANQSLAPLNITGNLSFSGTPVIQIDQGNVPNGQSIPLLVVGGTAPSNLPTLAGIAGKLTWGGAGNKTLYLTTSSGTVLFIE